MTERGQKTERDRVLENKEVSPQERDIYELIIKYM